VSHGKCGRSRRSDGTIAALRGLVVICIVEGVAAAQPAPVIPGTGGDGLRALELDPGVVTSSGFAIDGLAARGSAPEESRVLVDGFEVPFLYHDGVRTIVPRVMLGSVGLGTGSFDVDYGRATAGVLELETAQNAHRLEYDVSALDAAYAIRGAALVLAGRVSHVGVWAPSVLGDMDVAVAQAPSFGDAVVAHETRLRHWTLDVTGLFADDSDLVYTDRAMRDSAQLHRERDFGRATVNASYRDGKWSGLVAASSMLYQRIYERGLVQRDNDTELALDARAFMRCDIGWVIGLRDFAFELGSDLDITRHHLHVAMPRQPRENAPQVGDPDPNDTSHRFDGIVWRPDGGVFGWVEGGLSRAIKAHVALRVDAFDGELATQPRGEIVGELGAHTHLAVAAGAYRRPAEVREELEHPELHPERATQLQAMFVYARGHREEFSATAYYADRTHLVELDNDGVLRNSGRGNNLGIEVVYQQQDEHWFARVSGGLSRARRQDTPAMLERPAQYDQPVHGDAMAGWRQHGGITGWSIAGRFELRSGLPYTPVQGAIYDADRDAYAAVLGRTYAARLPFHHQLDVAIEHTWKLTRAWVTAYLDVANVYDNRSAVGYVYSYDFSQKVALESLPIFPMLGVRGSL
jgi:hypothetical protein